MKKNGVLSLAFILIVFMMTGCTSYNLSSHNEDLIAEYAADALLQNDAGYEKKLLKSDEIQIETTEEETTDENDTDESDGQGTSVTISEALGMTDFTITYASYEISDTYTEAVVAGEGLKVIVLKFYVTNITSGLAEFNLEPKTLIYSYKGLFNDTYTYNAQITMLLNALNSYKGTFAPGETRELVLIYKAPVEQLVDGISSISVTVITDQASNTIKLQ